MQKKLKSVVRHEYLTIIKQPGFIFSMIGLPVLIAAIMSISYFAEQSTTASIEEATSGIENVIVLDQSEIIDDEVVAATGFTMSTDTEEEVVESVKTQDVDGAIVFPNDLAETRTFNVFLGGGDDFRSSSALTDAGEQLIQASLLRYLDNEELGNLLLMGASGSVTAFEDGEETAGFGQYVAPGLIMGAFFIILFFSIGYMLLSVSEEKENRSMEMVLTYLQPRTLISGKLFAIGLVGLTQMLFFAAIGYTAYFVATRFELLTLPFDIDLSAIVLDPITISAGLVILVFGFLLYAAIMSGVASVMPSAKEANSFSGVFYLLAFVPFWVFGIIATLPESAIVKFLSFFPLTSPTTLLLRNTLGNISGIELLLAIAVLILSTVLSFLLAAKLFRMGALEFSDRVKIRSIFQ